jgi:hypothetical protein
VLEVFFGLFARGDELLRFFDAFSGQLDGFVLFFWLQSEAAGEAWPACKFDVDRASAPSGLRPADALAPPGAGHFLLFPRLYSEIGYIKAFFRLRLLLVLSW